jgi:hypothetical protein
MPEQRSPVRNLIGCNMALARQIFLEVGGFQEGMGRIGTYPAGCEETELCIRAGQRWPEGKLLYEPQARVRHLIPPSRASLRYFLSRCYAEGLSKAQVARLVGRENGLSSERSYALRTLPQGILHGLADLVLRFDASGLARAVAILAGLAWTTAGFVNGSLTRRIQRPLPVEELSFE